MRRAPGVVLLVEDDHAAAQGLAALLESEGFEVDHASSGATALGLVGAEYYSAVILDIGLPKFDGLTICTELRGRADTAGTPVPVVSGRHSIEDKVRALTLCADDYLTKPYAPAELLCRLRSLIRRSRHGVEGRVLRVGDLVLDYAQRRVHRGSREVHLAETGLRILGLLMAQSPRVVSRRQIHREIWGSTVPDSDSLRSHIYWLRRKIDEGRSGDGLLHTHFGHGFSVSERAAHTAARSA